MNLVDKLNEHVNTVLILDKVMNPCQLHLIKNCLFLGLTAYMFNYYL